MVDMSNGIRSAVPGLCIGLKYYSPHAAWIPPPDLHMHNTTELTPSDNHRLREVLGNNNDPARTTDVSEDNLPRPSLHLGAPGTPMTAQIIGLTRGKAVISREDLEEELRRKDNQINELKDLFVSRMEDHEKEQRRKDNQLSELMNRVAALEINLADRNPPSVKITPWRAFNTLLVLGLGVYKSIGTYQGQTTGPTTVDWIGSLVWATIVYWVSLYEPLSTMIPIQRSSSSGYFAGTCPISLPRSPHSGFSGLLGQRDTRNLCF
ncbi:hypothetical protein B0H14DRAFT_927648 [Mycena olivaceomarginata]|nr:hypothetical protein B0H14DRAFT_927648 [Mycena olivaceomarginata]